VKITNLVTYILGEDYHSPKLL